MEAIVFLVNPYYALFMKLFKHNVMKRDFLDTKKSCDYKNLVTSTVLIARILVIPRGHPRSVRDTCVRIKLQKDTHHLWAEKKTILRLKSDDELARQLLSSSIVHVHLL